MTEKSGRVHTSAVSVAILPQADEVLAILNCCAVLCEYYKIQQHRKFFLVPELTPVYFHY